MSAVVGVVVVQLQIAMANRTINNILIITSNQTEDLQPTHPFKLILFKHSFKVTEMSVTNLAVGRFRKGPINYINSLF
jgi:hypothetical protein